MPDFDLFVYHDFSTANTQELRAGTDVGSTFGQQFEGRYVAAIAPPIHNRKDATVVLSDGRHGRKVMPFVQARLTLGPSGLHEWDWDISDE